MHQAEVRAGVGDDAGQLGVAAKRGHVVDELGAQLERPTRDLGLRRVDRHRHADEPLEHRHDAAQLLVERHAARAGPRRLAAHVHQRGALGQQRRASHPRRRPAARFSPPSEKLSGVTLTIPTTLGRAQTFLERRTSHRTWRVALAVRGAARPARSRRSPPCSACSRSSPSPPAATRRPARGDTRRPSHLLIDTLVSLYIVLMVSARSSSSASSCCARTRRTSGAARREGRIRSLVILGLFLGVLALACGSRRTGVRARARRAPPPATPATTSGDAGPREGYEPEFAIVPVVIVAGIVALAVLALVVAARVAARALGPLGDPGLVEALEDVLAESLDDLRAEDDRAAAVVAAYARLERTLAAYGLPRRPSEAPAEYLERILAGLDVSHRSIERLTALFERAKFSQHEVDTA